MSEAPCATSAVPSAIARTPSAGALGRTSVSTPLDSRCCWICQVGSCAPSTTIARDGTPRAAAATTASVTLLAVFAVTVT